MLKTDFRQNYFSLARIAVSKYLLNMLYNSLHDTGNPLKTFIRNKTFLFRKLLRRGKFLLLCSKSFNFYKQQMSLLNQVPSIFSNS